MFAVFIPSQNLFSQFVGCELSLDNVYEGFFKKGRGTFYRDRLRNKLTGWQ